MSQQPYMEQYPHIFTSIVVGRKKEVYKNRLFVAPHARLRLCG